MSRSSASSRRCGWRPPDRPALHVPFARDRHQPRLEKVGLVPRQHEAGALSQQRRTCRSLRPSCCGPQSNLADKGADFTRWHNRAAQSGGRHGAGHSPDDAGRLILGDHQTAGRHQFGAAAHPILAHAGQDDGKSAPAVDPWQACASWDRRQGGRNSSGGSLLTAQPCWFPWSPAPCENRPAPDICGHPPAARRPWPRRRGCRTGA